MFGFKLWKWLRIVNLPPATSYQCCSCVRFRMVGLNPRKLPPFCQITRWFEARHKNFPQVASRDQKCGTAYRSRDAPRNISLKPISQKYLAPYPETYSRSRLWTSTRFEGGPSERKNQIWNLIGIMQIWIISHIISDNVNIITPETQILALVIALRA